MTFPRAERIRDASTINMLFKKGVKNVTPFFHVFCTFASRNTRVKIIVSIKIANKAVERHRIQRRIAAATRMVFSQSSLRKPLDILFLGNKKVLTASFEELKGVVRHVLNVFENRTFSA